MGSIIKSINFFSLFLVALICVGSALAECDAGPSITTSPESFTIKEGTSFSYDFNTTGNASAAYRLMLLDGKPTGLSLSPAGVLSIDAGREDGGEWKVAVIAFTDDCIDSSLVTLHVLTKPLFTLLEPAMPSFPMLQNQETIFSIEASGEAPIVNVTWLFDGREMNRTAGNRTVAYNPKFRVAGLHNMTVRVTDSNNMTAEHTWRFVITRVNRAPVLKAEVPGIMAFKNTATSSYDLDDYFMDPDGGPLTYSWARVVPKEANFTYADVSVNISLDGSVQYIPGDDSTGVAYVLFNATDIANSSSPSNQVRIDVLADQLVINITSFSSEEFCGNMICGNDENCSICPFDCGQCQADKVQGCKAAWNCTDWGPCLPQGIQLRNCTDLSLCDDNRTKPILAKFCEYNATCTDKMKNGLETGVDCGGPCDACPTCEDGIQNQGEQGIDCGSVCDPCASCTDGIKNQNESDIDCGGSCKGCAPGKPCFYSRDCESLNCIGGKCIAATCFDKIKNDGEEGMDCGGACDKLCGTCSDGVHNQGEEGVDCGGRCAPCPNCEDGKKNQDEIFADCGGSCRHCNATDFFLAYILWFLGLGFIVLGWLIGMFAYFFFLLARPEKAKRLYDTNSFFVMMVELNRFTRSLRKLRGKYPVLSPDQFNAYKSQLMEFQSRPSIKSADLHSAIKKAYSNILGLPDAFDDNVFYMKARESAVPTFLKVLFVGYYKKTDILLADTFIPIEKQIEIMVEFRFLLSELTKV